MTACGTWTSSVSDAASRAGRVPAIAGIVGTHAAEPSSPPCGSLRES